MPRPPPVDVNAAAAGFVHVRGAREHNLKSIDVDIPRDALVVFTGISGSGKSSLAFGTLYAEAQRRYLESVSPYAKRLFHQMATPKVDHIAGLPPAVALQQQRGTPTSRSSVGSITTLSNLLRMLYSRAGEYPAKQARLDAESFSTNTVSGACPTCHGLGRIHDVTEASMVPDRNLTIRERAVAAWPAAWHGQNLRDMLVTLGIDIDTPWKQLPAKTRRWILFTDEQPSVPVWAGYEAYEVRQARRRKTEPSYHGTFSSGRRYVTHTFATTQSAIMRKRVARYLVTRSCPGCKGKRLKREALSVHFEGVDIADLSGRSLEALRRTLAPYADDAPARLPRHLQRHPEQVLAASRICADFCARVDVLLDLGLGYLTLDRSTPTLSPGELQRLRLATQVVSNLFGVVYVLDEPSAGLHPADTQALLRALDRLKAAGNSLFVVEHELDVIRHADWIVDVGPGAGTHGGEVLYSGKPEGLRAVTASLTRRHLFENATTGARTPREVQRWLRLRGITRNNLQGVDCDVPLGVLACITGVSGSGKSSLVAQALVEQVADALGRPVCAGNPDEGEAQSELERDEVIPGEGRLEGGLQGIRRLVVVDQKPIGRTPRSNLATYTGLFDTVRSLFAKTPLARKRKYGAGQFSFNVASGRCPHCRGEGFVMVELLFLPSVYAPCPTCRGARYNAATLQVRYQDLDIAAVLALTVDAAATFFSGVPAVKGALDALQQVGLGYLRLGQPATELSGGEAQRIKLATELQRASAGSPTLYVLDEPTTGLHPADVEMLLAQLDGLVESGHSVVLIEHDMAVARRSDWIIDLGPGAGMAGGRIVAAGTPRAVAASRDSRTAPFLALAAGGR